MLAKPDKRHRLLVEAKDDVSVLASLKEHYQLPWFYIDAKGSVEQVIDSLDVEIDAPGTDAIGIVVDADFSLANRWASIANVLRIVGYAVPANPDPAGTILVQDEKPRIGVWIMPDNQSPGMLENFYEALVAPNNALWQRASEAVAAIPEKERLFPKHYFVKAHVHTWLSWQREPGRPMGIGVKSHLKLETPQALALVDWLKRLFLEG